MEGDVRRCVCGQKLNSYNTSGVCGPCAVHEGDEVIRRAMEPQSEFMPPEELSGCRHPGCPNPICEKSLAAQAAAHRWRRLCAEHYSEQRTRQSRRAREDRASRAARARTTGEQLAS